MKYLVLFYEYDGTLTYREVNTKTEAIEVAREKRGTIVEAFEFDIKKAGKQMRYLIVEQGEAFEKFEIEKKHLIEVKNERIDIIIDTEEGKFFSKTWNDEEPVWHDMKPYDKRYED